MIYGDSQNFSSSAADNSLASLFSVLGVDSTLGELPLYEISLSLEAWGTEAAQVFERTPELPGIMLTDDNAKVVGVLSRQRFLEFLLRPQGLDLFLSQPLQVLYSYARLPPLSLPQSTPILVAARGMLRRSMDLQGEPILVTGQLGDRLLSTHDLNVAHWQIRGIETQIRYERTQADMLKTHKMAVLGRLVDGVAHEILNPLGFIWGNLTYVSQYCQQLTDLIAAYEEVLPSEMASTSSLASLKDEIDLEYIKEDLPSTIRSMQNGAERLKQLATSLQNFCHIDSVHPRPTDLHELIDSIVFLLQSRLTTQIQVVRQYASLPPVSCFAGQLGQVFMNILTNCMDTLLAKTARQKIAVDLGLTIEGGMSFRTAEAPQIVITTGFCSASTTEEQLGNRWIFITFADNGPGLSAAAQQQISNSFSIEQRLEKETDLAMSYRIVTAKHGGKFYVRSRSFSDQETAPGIGTEFEIRLPLYSPHEGSESRRIHD